METLSVTSHQLYREHVRSTARALGGLIDLGWKGGMEGLPNIGRILGPTDGILPQGEPLAVEFWGVQNGGKSTILSQLESLYPHDVKYYPPLIHEADYLTRFAGYAFEHAAGLGIERSAALDIEVTNALLFFEHFRVVKRILPFDFDPKGSPHEDIKSLFDLFNNFLFDGLIDSQHQLDQLKERLGFRELTLSPDKLQRAFEISKKTIEERTDGEYMIIVDAGARISLKIGTLLATFGIYTDKPTPNINIPFHELNVSDMFLLFRFASFVLEPEEIEIWLNEVKHRYPKLDDMNYPHTFHLWYAEALSDRLAQFIAGSRDQSNPNVAIFDEDFFSALAYLRTSFSLGEIPIFPMLDSMLSLSSYLVLKGAHMSEQKVLTAAILFLAPPDVSLLREGRSSGPLTTSEFMQEQWFQLLRIYYELIMYRKLPTIIATVDASGSLDQTMDQVIRSLNTIFACAQHDVRIR